MDLLEVLTKAGIIGVLVYFLWRAEQDKASLLADLKAERAENKEIAKAATIALTKAETTLANLAQIFLAGGKNPG